MQEIVVARGSEVLLSLPLDRDSFRIGRAPTNDLALPDQTVSRHQCELVRSGRDWKLKDRSGAGTMVNGKRYKTTKLQAGSVVELGSFQVSIRELEEVVPLVTAAGVGVTDVMPLDGEGEEAELTITVRIGDKQLRMPLTGTVLNIGSDSGNDLVIEDDTFVSSFHCRIYRQKGAWWVIDLDSTNGVRVGGVQVQEAKLEPGCVLEVGHSLITALGPEADKDTGAVGFHGIVSEDPAMKPVFNWIERAAPSDYNVLIVGETGTGKELLARAIHRCSRRAHKPMLSLNCSAITRELLESELFGHEKGAFTGADVDRKGLFEEADGGMLFLDEIGELALESQAKLLRVLDSGEIRRVGSNIPKHIDTRVIAATHRPLQELVRAGQFRDDLFQRLMVLDCRLPPLRERKADIPLLANFFLEVATRHVMGRKSLTRGALNKLEAYHFPGNVRELKHIIHRAAVMCPEDKIGADFIEYMPTSMEDRISEAEVYFPGMTMEEGVKRIIQQALEANNQNRNLAAKQLGISRSTLKDKIRKYGLGEQ